MQSMNEPVWVLVRACEPSAPRCSAFFFKLSHALCVCRLDQVAFFGDAGASDPQRYVLEMVKAWGADFVIHIGDFEYQGA